MRKPKRKNKTLAYRVDYIRERDSLWYTVHDYEKADVVDKVSHRLSKVVIVMAEALVRSRPKR